MIDHMSVGVDDLEKAKQFYTPVFARLGFGLMAEMAGLLAYGENAIQFLAMLPFDGKRPGVGNGMHVAFRANSVEQVDAFHAAALAAGAVCEGMPGVRAYPHEEVYAAYIRDPFGHKLEALTNGFTQKT